QAYLFSNFVSNNVVGENIVEISGSGESISSGNNLIGNGDNVDGFVNGENDDLVGTKDAPIDPQLGELQNNGGITQTFALKESSPAIDAGKAPSSLLTDQRGEGFARFVGTSTDIGAYELQSVDADDDDTISTANDSGVSPDGQQSVVISNAIASDLDVDLFELELESGDVATFNIEAQEFGSSLDSVLRIFDSEGNELAFDNDSDGPFERANGDSYVEYRAEADGNYYVGVSSFENVSYDPVNADNTSGSSNGDYDLAISAFYGVEGTSGGDNLTGTDEADFISGIDGNDTLSGGESRDNLLGGNGNDIINGGDGDDLLRGEAGSDVLRGGNGNDTLGGNDGQNKLYGGQGNDVFAVGSGSDTIFDFQNDTDKILLTGSFESASFEDLLISTVDQGVGISTQDDSSQVIVLVGVSPELITQDDFVGNEFINPTFRLA
ncbi:MAG: choice-of-anchor Q domain-containing protein, partial [Pleurocapsa sp.]